MPLAAIAHVHVHPSTVVLITKEAFYNGQGHDSLPVDDLTPQLGSRRLGTITIDEGENPVTHR